MAAKFVFLFLSVAISSIVSAPILSAFTLPLYFVAFPRQLRFWPYTTENSGSPETSGDAVYYEQMITPLLEQIHKSLRQSTFSLLGKIFE